MEKKTNRWGRAFLITASAMIMIFSFYPMIAALITSFKTGSSANMKWAEPWYNNYARMFKDKTFITSLKNTFLYLIIQVPVMLVLAIPTSNAGDCFAPASSCPAQSHWSLTR